MWLLLVCMVIDGVGGRDVVGIVDVSCAVVVMVGGDCVVVEGCGAVMIDGVRHRINTSGNRRCNSIRCNRSKRSCGCNRSCNISTIRDVTVVDVVVVGVVSVGRCA